MAFSDLDYGWRNERFTLTDVRIRRRIELLQLGEDGTPATQKEIADVMNRPKNATKHFELQAGFDPKDAAEAMLERAVTNYYLLMQYLDLEETGRLRPFTKVRLEARRSPHS